jgi:hypothetical protein
MAVLSESSYWSALTSNRSVLTAIKEEGIKPTYVGRSDKFDWGGANGRS